MSNSLHFILQWYVPKKKGKEDKNYSSPSRAKINVQPCSDFYTNRKMVVPVIGTKSMQNTSAYEEPKSSGKQLHAYFLVLDQFISR